MSIEYEDLTMLYGCLECKHEWYNYCHSSTQSHHLECPECTSQVIWEDGDARESNRLIYDDFIQK